MAFRATCQFSRVGREKTCPSTDRNGDTHHDDQNIERLKELVIKRFREQRVEPPRNDRIERLIRSACHIYEQALFANTFQKLLQVTCERFDALLTHSVTAEEIASPENEEEEEVPAAYAEIDLHDLKTNPGPVGLESVMKEIAKLRLLDHFTLPTDLFSTLSPKVLSLYRQRAAAEPWKPKLWYTSDNTEML